MRTGGAQLGDGVGQCIEGCNVEDRVRVFAVKHATLGEDDANEVDAA